LYLPLLRGKGFVSTCLSICMAIYIYQAIPMYAHLYISIYLSIYPYIHTSTYIYLSRASVLETLLTAHTRLVLQTATYRRQKTSTQTETKIWTPCNGVLNTEQGGVSYKPTEAPACAEAEPRHRQRLEANALLLCLAKCIDPARWRCPPAHLYFCMHICTSISIYLSTYLPISRVNPSPSPLLVGHTD